MLFGGYPECSLFKFRFDIQFPAEEDPSGIRLPELTAVAWPEDSQEPQVAQASSQQQQHLTLDSATQPSAKQQSVAGNIHREEYNAFWRDNLKPDLWTARVRAEGYKLSFENGKWPEHTMKRTIDQP